MWRCGPKPPYAYSVRGLAYAQENRFDEAERDLNKAVQSSQDSGPSRLNRGVVYWNQKKNDAALADFKAVLELPQEKRLVEAAYYRGQLYLQLGEVEKALKDFDQVVAQNPSFLPVYPLRARIHIAKGDKPAALADLDAYLAGRPTADGDGDVHGKRGRLLRLMYAELPLEQRSKPSAVALAALAVEELSRSAALDSKTPEVFDDLGAMLELSGRLKDALGLHQGNRARSQERILAIETRAGLMSKSANTTKRRPISPPPPASIPPTRRPIRAWVTWTPYGSCPPRPSAKPTSPYLAAPTII